MINAYFKVNKIHTSDDLKYILQGEPTQIGVHLTGPG